MLRKKHELCCLFFIDGQGHTDIHCLSIDPVRRVYMSVPECITLPCSESSIKVQNRFMTTKGLTGAASPALSTDNKESQNSSFSRVGSDASSGDEAKNIVQTGVPQSLFGCFWDVI